MFLLHIVQSGGGCDYTIDCGQTLVNLKAETIEQAILESAEKLQYYGFDHRHDSERTIESCTLYQAEAIPHNIFDAKEILRNQYLQEQVELQKEKEKEERQVFERLKAKFKE